ncbi:DUF2927 domain-containing protein [Gymnodinialimonas sp. 2305UL16-5]|uniref:DUF2927 domain-containing protein n=1 Tax=Gymnodinialimonas mytili TaxID=3126503 RepID=UPI0030AC8BE4
MILRFLPGLALTIAFAACTPTNGDVAERSENIPTALPVMNTFGAHNTPRPSRSNTAIAADFLDLTFQMESGRVIDRMSRFEGPITVAVTPGAPAHLIADLDGLIARLRSEAGIDISRVSGGAGGSASIIVETLPRARMQRVVPQAACFVVPRVASWSEFRRSRAGRTLDWTTLNSREHVAVFIPSDVAPQEVRDCLHEEIAQALGPLNDLYRLPDSVFNDDNFHAVLTGFDMLILRTYYDDALQSGMTRAEVASRLPAILARLNPRGGRGSELSRSHTPREWIAAIETALGPGTTDIERIAAANQAVQFAQRSGWSDSRLAFSYFALGRLTLSREVETSIAAFQSASAIFDRVAPGGIQSAHIDMQLAAFALAAGRSEESLRLTARAMPIATQAQNASLLSTLLMIRAEAMDNLGRASEARAVRLDSLAWGRYGFGSDRVGTRLSEVAALSPRR